MPEAWIVKMATANFVTKRMARNCFLIPTDLSNSVYIERTKILQCPFLLHKDIISQKIYSSQQFVLVLRNIFKNANTKYDILVRYHSGGSMKLNACILHLAYMVYL